MGQLYLKRFTKRDVFDRIADALITQFLGRFAEYLTSRGIDLALKPLDVDRLLDVLANPNEDTPHDLIEALHIIDEMATPAGSDALLAEFGPAIAAPITDAPLTPADMAVRAWLDDPMRLARCHARQLTLRKRALQTHRLSDEQAEAVAAELDAAALASIEHRLQQGFVDLQRGGHVRVRRLSDGPLERYSISHGGVVVRTGAVDQGGSIVVHYRPLEHDLIIFDRRRREISVKRHPPRERDLYLQAFGEALIGDEAAFQIQPVLNLEPIRQDGRGCLHCDDIGGLAEVTLTGVQCLMHPTRRWRRNEKAEDLFLALEEAGSSLPRFAPIESATFEFRFDGSVKTRSVGISQDGVIKYTRDSDQEAIDAWLRRRGFIRGRVTAAIDERPLWECLGRPAEWTAQRSVWEERLGSLNEKFSVFLRPAPTIHVIPRANRRPLEVVADGEGGQVIVDPDTGSWRPLDDDGAETLTVHTDLLMSAVAAALSLVGDRSRPVADVSQCWWLGDYTPFEGDRFPAYLITSIDAVHVESVVGRLIARTVDPFVLVTPTRACSGPELQQMIAARRLAWLSLDETLDLIDAGAFEVCIPLDEQLNRFLRQNCPERLGETPRPRFPTPLGTTWEKVHMVFKDGHHLEITIDEVVKKVSFTETSMADGRTKKPNRLWRLLLKCADQGGFIAIGEGRRQTASYREKADLVKVLCDYFSIPGDPFSLGVGGWDARFSIKPDR